MRINIAEDTMGLMVKLIGSREEFENLLACFKGAIPPACRSFNNGRWFVHKRDRGKVLRWAEDMKSFYGAQIELAGQGRELTPIGVKAESSESLPLANDGWLAEKTEAPLSKDLTRELLKQARTNNYLSISESQGVVELSYQAEQSKSKLPAITLQKLDRCFEVRAHVYGDRLTDEARNKIFSVLMQYALPGATVRASNSGVCASRIPFGVGDVLAQWLASLMNDPGNRAPGRGRDYARVEGRKLTDGSIKMIQGGITRRAA
jgi:hypothetical protein